MKFLGSSVNLFLLGSASAEDKNRPELEQMLDFYNKDFNVDSNYYKNYGCNCLGDLDREGIGGGKVLGTWFNSTVKSSST